MDYNLNNFASDLFPLLVGNDKLKSFLTNDINLVDEDLIALSIEFINFHEKSEKKLVEIFQDLPDIPMHNSYNTSETFGLPLMEKDMNNIVNKSTSYKLDTWNEAENVLRRYYQDTLRNHEIPDVYREIVSDQLNEFSDLLAKLGTASTIQD